MRSRGTRRATVTGPRTSVHEPSHERDGDDNGNGMPPEINHPIECMRVRVPLDSSYVTLFFWRPMSVSVSLATVLDLE
jgi:hypothetical protein